MSLEILAIGTALPTHSITQPHAAELAKVLCCRTEEQERFLEALYKRTRIQKRGSVLLEVENEQEPTQDFFPERNGSDQGPSTGKRMERYAEEASPLALTAAGQALGESALVPQEITHLITVSCTGFTAPGVDTALIKGLGLNKNVARTHVGFMGCHGALNALRVASSFVGSDPRARVLLCAVELCSLHFSYGWDPEKMVANGLFADGAAALVGVPESSKEKMKPEAWRLKANGSALFPNSENAMTWRIGNNGFEMTLSASVPALISSYLNPIVEEWLNQHGLTIEEIGSWAIHPGGPRIVDEVQSCLRLPEEKTAVSRQILAEYGNMSSPTILFILDRLRRLHAPKPCLALGFGPGLAVEMALFV